MNTLKPLTPEEALLVELATRGESYAHRRWPAEVITAFAAAEVAAGANRSAHGAAALALRLRAWFRAGSATEWALPQQAVRYPRDRA